MAELREAIRKGWWPRVPIGGIGVVICLALFLTGNAGTQSASSTACREDAAGLLGKIVDERTQHVGAPAGTPRGAQSESTSPSQIDHRPSAIFSTPRPPLAKAPFDAAQAKAHQQAWAEHLGLPVETTNSLSMRLALIPPGEFQMGSPPTEATRSQEERQHRVRITRPFYLGVYTVTQAEYEQVMGSNPSFFSAKGKGRDQVAGMDTSRFPVESVSWNDAAEFCQRLSRREGKTYRLPTEAEWEYAGRAGTTTTFNCGDSLSSTQANFNGNFPYGGAAKGAYLRRTTAVGSYRPNALGLYDIHGNVWQWCSDRFGSDYYANSPLDNPQGPAAGNNRVLRGIGWQFCGPLCRSAYRYRQDAAHPFNSFGFRIACEP